MTTLGVSLSILAAQTLGGILLARSLGPAGRGEFAALVLWAALAFDIAALGTPGAVAYWAASSDPRAGLRLVRRAYPVLAFAGVALFAILLFLSGRAGSLALVGICAFALWVPIRIGVMPMIRYEQGCGNMVVFNRLRAVPEIGPVLGYAVAAMFGVLTVGVASTSVLVFLVAAGLWAMREVRRTGSAHRATADSPRVVSPRAFWKYSLAEWVSVLATKGNRTIDLFLLTMLAVSTAQIGLYAVAATAAAVLAVIGVSLGMVLFPRVTASDIQSGQEVAHPEIRFSDGSDRIGCGGRICVHRRLAGSFGVRRRVQCGDRAGAGSRVRRGWTRSCASSR